MNITDIINGLFTNTDFLINYCLIILSIILIIAAVFILSHFGSKLIDKFFTRRKRFRYSSNDRKSDTLSGILKSALRYFLYIIGGLMILDQLGFKIQTLLIGAGLSGIIVGFGAQNLVKDVISGFFILFEDQFSVGEYITIDDISGVVDSIGLRITRIKGFSGELSIVPNGSINRVINHSRDKTSAIVDVMVDYNTDIERVFHILETLSADMGRGNEDILEGPEVLGLIKFDGNGLTIRISAKTKPMYNWGVEREIRKKVKETFDREKINMFSSTRVCIAENGNN